MVKHNQTLRRPNELLECDHFVGLALKGLNIYGQTYRKFLLKKFFLAIDFFDLVQTSMLLVVISSNIFELHLHALIEHLSLDFEKTECKIEIEVATLRRSMYTLLVF